MQDAEEMWVCLRRRTSPYSAEEREACVSTAQDKGPGGRTSCRQKRENFSQTRQHFARPRAPGMVRNARCQRAKGTVSNPHVLFFFFF